MRLTTHHVLASAAAATAAVLTLSACAPGAGDDGDGAGAGSESIEVGVITSETGPLAAYGTQFLTGFEAGLDYATDGTGEVGGVTIEIRNGDDTGDPDKAVQLAKEYVGDGVSILTGTVSSGISLSLAEQAEQNKVLYVSGAAAADAITGLNDYTFRSGRQSMQDVATAGTFLDDIDGQKVVVYAQDNAFGQGNSAAVEALLGAKGATVQPLLVRRGHQGVHLLLPAAQGRRTRPGVRGLGRRDHGVDVAVAGAAGCLRRRSGRDRTR